MLKEGLYLIQILIPIAPFLLIACAVPYSICSLIVFKGKYPLCPIIAFVRRHLFTRPLNFIRKAMISFLSEAIVRIALIKKRINEVSFLFFGKIAI